MFVFQFILFCLLFFPEGGGEIKHHLFHQGRDHRVPENCTIRHFFFTVKNKRNNYIYLVGMKISIVLHSITQHPLNYINATF